MRNREQHEHINLFAIGNTKVCSLMTVAPYKNLYVTDLSKVINHFNCQNAFFDTIMQKKTVLCSILYL